MTGPRHGAIRAEPRGRRQFRGGLRGGCFAVLAACLRFARKPSPLLDGLANNAFAIYLLHYAFVVWLQYALLGVALFAFAKGMIVLTARWCSPGSQPRHCVWFRSARD